MGRGTHNENQQRGSVKVKNGGRKWIKIWRKTRAPLFPKKKNDRKTKRPNQRSSGGHTHRREYVGVCLGLGGVVVVCKWGGGKRQIKIGDKSRVFQKKKDLVAKFRIQEGIQQSGHPWRIGG